MRTIVAILMTVTLESAPQLYAVQRLHPFATAGMHTDNSRHYAGVTGGAVYDIVGPWISAGIEADVFFSGGYAAGRGGPVAQFGFLGNSHFRPFAIGGYKWGEGDGGMVGGGLEYRPHGRFGFRGSVEDVIKHVSPLCRPPYIPCTTPISGHNTHGVSIQLGVTFR